MINNSGDKKVRRWGQGRREREREREREGRISRKNPRLKHISLSYKPLLKQSLFQVRMYAHGGGFPKINNCCDNKVRVRGRGRRARARPDSEK